MASWPSPQPITSPSEECKTAARSRDLISPVADIRSTIGGARQRSAGGDR